MEILGVSHHELELIRWTMWTLFGISYTARINTVDDMDIIWGLITLTRVNTLDNINIGWDIITRLELIRWTIWTLFGVSQHQLELTRRTIRRLLGGWGWGWGVHNKARVNTFYVMDIVLSLS